MSRCGTNGMMTAAQTPSAHRKERMGSLGRIRMRHLLPSLIAAGMVTAAGPLVAQEGPGGSGYERPRRLLWLDDKIEGRAVTTPHHGSSISAGGGEVAFVSDAPLSSSDLNQQPDVYVRRISRDEPELASRTGSGIAGLGMSLDPSISSNGRFVAFASNAPDLVVGDTNAMQDIFVYDRRAGSVERVSVDSDGRQAMLPLDGSTVGLVLGDLGSLRPSISATGRFVSFTSVADNLVQDDSNERPDVFVHDRKSGRTMRVSVDSEGSQSDPCPGESVDLLLLLGCEIPASSVSGNGRHVAFHSDAANLVAGDANGITDVFVHDLRSGNTERVSIASDGSEASRTVDHHARSGLGSLVGSGRALSHDGRLVAFTSIVADLVPNDTNRGVPIQGHDGMDVFVHDRKTARTERVSVEPDGREVGPLSDVPVGTVPFRLGSISPDGRHLAFDFFSQPGSSYYRCGESCQDGPNAYVFTADRATGEIDRITNPEADDPVSHWGTGSSPDISRGGRFLSFSAFFNSTGVPTCTTCWASFWADRGKQLGTSELIEATGDGGSTFGPRSLVEAVDSAGDASLPGRGAEIVGSTVSVRPSHGDLYLRVDVDRLPGPRGGIDGLPAAGDPAVIYGVRFSVGGTSYEMRVSRTGTLGGAGTPVFGLFRCESGCSEVAKIHGGYGTTGESVVASVPLDLIDPDRADRKIAVDSAYSAVGVYASGAIEILDELPFGPR